MIPHCGERVRSTVDRVTAPEGFAEAERRAIRHSAAQAVQRAAEWNVENAGGILPHRPQSRDEYRVVSIGLTGWSKRPGP